MKKNNSQKFLNQNHPLSKVEKSKVLLVTLLTFNFFFFCSVAFSQQKKIDSLFSVLKTISEDTNKINLLIQLARLHLNTQPDSTESLSIQALRLSEKLKMRKYIGNSYLNLANSFWIRGIYPTALEKYISSLRSFEKDGFKKGISAANSGIALIYQEQKKWDEALKYYSVSLQISEKIKDTKLISIICGNMSNIFRNKKEYKEALKFAFRALTIKEQAGNHNGTGVILGNIGNIYSDKGQHDLALTYKLKALDIAEKIGDKKSVIINLANIGNTYTSLKIFSRAELYYLLAIRKSDSMNLLAESVETNKNLGSLYEKTGNYKLAFDFYKKHINLRNKLINEENTKKQTQMEMQYEFDKQHIADSIKSAERVNQEVLKHELEIRQQKTFTYGGFLGFLLMFTAAAVSFRAFKQKQKSNNIIFEQKKVLEEKQKEILDSIHYAKRIQRSLLPTEKYIDRILSEST